MKTDSIVSSLFLGKRKVAYECNGAPCPLTKSPHIKTYPYVADPKVSEGDLLPIGKAALTQIRQCKTAKTIQTISIGPKRIVIRFAIHSGNPYGTIFRKKKPDENAILEVLQAVCV